MRVALSCSLAVKLKLSYFGNIKGKFLYSTVASPLDRLKRFTLPPPLGRPVHSDTHSNSLGSILAMQQLRVKTIHSHIQCTPLSIVRYSFIQLSGLRHLWREQKCPTFETVANGVFEHGLSRLRVRHSTTELPLCFMRRNHGMEKIRMVSYNKHIQAACLLSV